VAIFAILAAGMLGTFAALSRSVKASREKTIVSSLALSYMEIVKNMPYSDVGTVSGNPHGNLPDFSNAFTSTIGGTLYKIYYEVTYIDDPADGTALAGSDPVPADYKQVKMNVLNNSTGQVSSFVTNIVPKGLEGMSNAGAILFKVFNWQGQPVNGANIHITYPVSNPSIILDRQTDASGQWLEVGLPAAVNNYRIVATKTGYSTDRTYPITDDNPNPTNPDPTVENSKVTTVILSIDYLSNLTIKTLNSFCQNLSGINLNVSGAKLIGTNPAVLKYNQNFTSVNGSVILNNLEWDTYTPTLLSGQSWVVRGTSPIQKIDVLPGTSQTFTLILGANSTANSLLVIVKDAATKAPLEGASVNLHKGGSVPQDYYGSTGGSVWMQNSWVGGPGLINWSTSTPTRYFQDNGNIDINSVPTGVRLNKIFGRYVSPGWLESSTFDSGSSNSNYTTITWEPASQDAAAELKFQIASSDVSDGPWQYVGPDGTADSFYTVSGSNISTSHDNKRYVRYKTFLATSDDKKTPVLTSININYVSGCFTPGQFFFGDLTAGNNYDLYVSLDGYQTATVNSLDINGNQSLEVLLSP